MDRLEDLDQEKLEKTAIFMAKMVVAGLFFRALLFISPDTYFVESALASVTAEILMKSGTALELFGNRLVIGNNIFVVTQDCLGWKSIAAFTGLTWASDISNKRKVVLLGAFSLIILNLVRILTTIILSVNGVISFEILHMFLWRWGLTAAVFGLWILNLKTDLASWELR